MVSLFFSHSVFIRGGGHSHRMFKRFPGVNASKYFSVNRSFVYVTFCNSLPVTVVEAPSVTVFR